MYSKYIMKNSSDLETLALLKFQIKALKDMSEAKI